ncbi:aldolase/citrate lyase family protein [Streptomyces sp. NPDC093109]|uniref:HpcH/HpaI aldolase family protein n=1 Tax=Streptomyces sp. NPDC093109 TaxID=3154977 RepID=UPI00344F953A
MTFHSDTLSLGLWSSLATGQTVRLLAAANPDWLILDAQHGGWGDATLAAELPALVGSVPVWVRLADDRAAGIGRALDAGAAGVIVPMVNSAEQAAAVVAACRYPPLGERSWGPMLPSFGRPAPGTAEANETVGCAVMVETPRALADADAIARVPGVDMVFVGPFDLSIALGVPLDDLLGDDAPTAPLPSVVRACRAGGVRAGAFAGDPDRAERLIELGFSDVVIATDAGLLGTAAGAALGRFGAGAAGHSRGGY